MCVSERGWCAAMCVSERLQCVLVKGVGVLCAAMCVSERVCCNVCW